MPNGRPLSLQPVALRSPNHIPRRPSVRRHRGSTPGVSNRAATPTAPSRRISAAVVHCAQSPCMVSATTSWCDAPSERPRPSRPSNWLWGLVCSPVYLLGCLLATPLETLGLTSYDCLTSKSAILGRGGEVHVERPHPLRPSHLAHGHGSSSPVSGLPRHGPTRS